MPVFQVSVLNQYCAANIILFRQDCNVRPKVGQQRVAQRQMGF